MGYKEELIALYLKEFGINLDDPNFKETPRRIVKMHEELLAGLQGDIKAEIDEILSKKFPTNNDDMVIFKGIKSVGLCPHHFAPFRTSCSIAYIPDGKEVIGLSKIPRIVELLSKRPVLQETLTSEIADALASAGSKGVMVVITGTHSCMTDRGVKSSAQVVTSAIRGLFKNDSDAKAEAIRLMNIS